MPAKGDIKHIVVLMMENRSFDHMLGALKQEDPRINGLSGDESNPDTTNEQMKVQPLAVFQGQLDPDPDHHFPGVNTQLYYGKVALARGDLDFSHLVHSYTAGLTLRAGGFPQVWLQFAWGGHEGTHTIAAMNTSLLGGAARPSLY